MKVEQSLFMNQQQEQDETNTTLSFMSKHPNIHTSIYT